jgi:glyoxylase-like metal-dependent hydrolase (beta-lactamase superfamily II)
MTERTIVEQRDECIYQVRVPLPFPLRWVNSYVIRGDEGCTIIDPGLRTADAELSWQTAMEEIGLTYESIKRIVLTHHHPDHIGLAGWFQEHTGAPVLLSAAGQRQVSYLWGEERRAPRELQEAFLLHGMDEQIASEIYTHMESFMEQVSPLPRITEIEEGQIIQLGDRGFRTIHTPGHAFGHLSLFHAESGDLFCGDHVLPQITPNVGWLPGVDEDPLDSYLTSLARFAELPAKRIFPGHREPFTQLSERCMELIRHHEVRLDQLVEMVQTPRTTFEICREYFGNRLSIHQLRFAMAETLAHMIRLRYAGRVEEYTEQGIIYYRSK